LYDLIDSYIWLRISFRIFLSWSYLSLLWLSYLYFFWYDILFLFYLYWFLSYDCCLLENCVRFLFEFIWGCTILREQNDFLCLPHILLWGFINSPPFLMAPFAKHWNRQTLIFCLIKLYFYPIGLDGINSVCPFQQCRYPKTQPWLR